MHPIKMLVYCAIATVPIVASALQPPPMTVVVEPPMNNPCANIQWSGQFLADYPRAPVHCQTVEEQNGVKYARFLGKVVRVDPSSVEVDLVNVAGTPDTSMDWAKTSDDGISINDKPAKVGDLKTDDSVTFWVQEGMYLISGRPGGPALPISNVKRVSQNSD